MNPNKTTTTFAVALAGLLLAGPLAATAQTPTPPTQHTTKNPPAFYPDPKTTKQPDPQQVQQIEQKLHQVNQSLNQIQSQATQKPAVKTKAADFRKALYKKMIASAPDMKSDIQKLQKLTGELRNDPELKQPAVERSDAFKKKLATYSKLNGELRPVAQQAARDPDVAKLGRDYQTAMVTAMNNINPQTQQLFQQRQQLYQSLQTLQSGNNGAAAGAQPGAATAN